jgi:hypothetical protein
VPAISAQILQFFIVDPNKSVNHDRRFASQEGRVGGGPFSLGENHKLINGSFMIKNLWRHSESGKRMNRQVVTIERLYFIIIFSQRSGAPKRERRQNANAVYKGAH